jgi:hypothetical protein
MNYEEGFRRVAMLISIAALPITVLIISWANDWEAPRSGLELLGYVVFGAIASGIVWCVLRAVRWAVDGFRAGPTRQHQ